MLLGRGRSKERNVTPPGPSYMSNDQFAQYLADLRNNRVTRPSGARPQPISSRRQSDRVISQVSTQPAPTTDPQDSPLGEFPSRPGSAFSHRRAQSSLSTYSSVGSKRGRQLLQQQLQAETIAPLKPSEVVPSATYVERGQRWMEKEEAVSLREAMEDMDLIKEEEEARILAAAQEEASELVWQHQNGESPPKPDSPYRYKEHLKKNSYAHARTQSVGRYGEINTGLARDMPPRSVSGGSNSSDDLQSPRGRISSGWSNTSHLESNMSPESVRGSLDSRREFMTQRPQPMARGSLDSSRDAIAQQANGKSYGSIGKSNLGTLRRTSGKRNISGEPMGSFSGEQIWEEPEEESPDRGRSPEARDMPAPLRLKPRNPLNRVQFASESSPRSNSTPAPETSKRLSKYEIHRNPPSQSKNPSYTANPPPAKAPEQPEEQAKEIRSDEIRQATSMRLKDRSPKLPTPTVVSDKPGRPIVSFDKDWKPKEADDKPEVRRRSPFDRRSGSQKQSSPARPVQAPVSTPIPTVQLPNISPAQVNRTPLVSVPSINISNPQSPVPTISLPVSARPSVPTINFPDSTPSIPTINFPDSTPSIPTINRPNAPQISVSAPAIPTISEPGSSQPQSTRPLPDPKTASKRPLPRHGATVSIPRGHWSPTAGSRATATCHQCQLPIEGRVVALRGIPERFHPQCFICFTCGTSLEALEISPEPQHKRNERLDRIKRRAQGEQIPDIEGQTEAEDGDDRLRFYCHLDWHELYAPRCKHCKTPIIGEHAVALGEHWHYGHFFCAECGDPFEQGMTHIEKDGYAWCLNCQTKRTERQAPKCKNCRKPVIGQYVQALGSEWHDECFRCATCKGGFEDGQIFPKEVRGETIVLCTGCMERELKA